MVDTYHDNMNSATSSTVPCDIIKIHAPPGVEVQAFALRLPLGGSESTNNWLSLVGEDGCSGGIHCPFRACTPPGKIPLDGSASLPDNQIASCTWSSSISSDTPNSDAWWSYGATNFITDERRDLAAFKPFESPDFGNMQDWWPLHQTLWNSAGCGGGDMGVCSVRIRLKNTPGEGRSLCGRKKKAATAAVISIATESKSPQCEYIMNSEAFSAFTIVSGQNASLYHCGPCTRTSALIANAAATSSYFNCFLSSDGGITSDDSLLHETAVPQTTSYLSDPSTLMDMITPFSTGMTMQSTTTNQQSFFEISERILNNGTALDILTKSYSDDDNQQQNSNNINQALSLSLLRWGQLATAAEAGMMKGGGGKGCTVSTPSGCWLGLDLNFFLSSDSTIWNRAVANPDLFFTMTCKEQKYTQDDAQRCNPVLDVRRQLLNQFVDRQYRKRNGVWMHTAAPGTGVAWVANVANSKVGMFSLMYASTQRAESETLAKWILGPGPCFSEPTIIQDRICMQSTIHDDLFQPMHPWMGGDFNPFEKLDECPSMVTSNGQASLCSCVCEPSSACIDPNGLHNYTADTMAAEFPILPHCINQAFPQTRTMQNTDESNICGFARSATVPKQCMHTQVPPPYIFLEIIIIIIIIIKLECVCEQ